MATAILQFRVKPSGGSYGSIQTGSATLAAEDEVQLLAASYSGWKSARWEIQEYPVDYPCPAGWSTDASSGAYYYASSPITGLAPPPFTMPEEADIVAGQWGKWLCRVIVSTSAGTITSDPRVGLKIVSPSLGLNGIAFTEEDEFNAPRAYPGELQEDLTTIDGAALASGGFVSAAAATRPIKVSGSTGAVTWSWEPNATVNNQGFGFSACPSIANAAGALALSAGAGGASLTGSTTASVTASGGALSLSGSTTASLSAGGGALTLGGSTATKVTNLAGVGTRFVTAAADGTLGTSSSAGASATAAYLEMAATALNTNGVPAWALTNPLLFASDSNFPILILDVEDSTTTGAVSVLQINRDTSGTPANDIAGSVEFTTQNADSDPITAGLISVGLSNVTPLSEAGFFSVKLWSGGGLVERLALTSAGMLTVASATISGLGSGVVRASSGVLSASALSSGDITGALGFTPVTNARTLSGTSPIRVDGGASADLSANRTLSFLVASDIAWGGWGITGIASLDNSGGTLTIGANTTGQTIGKAATTASFPGSAAITGTVAGGAATFTVADTTNNAVSTAQTLQHTLSSGTAAANIGVRQRWQLPDAAGNVEDAVYVDAILTTATNGAEVSEWSVWTRTSGGTPSKRAYYSGNAPGIGGTALVADTMIAASGNGFLVYAFSTAAGSSSTWGGVNYNDSDSGVRFYATGSAQSLYLRTNSVNRVKIGPDGAQTHVRNDETEIVHQVGTNLFRRERRKITTTTDATSTDVLSFTVPASSAGTIRMRVNQVDVTGGTSGTDAAYYERLIRFSRRNSGTVVTTSIGTDIVSRDDAAWDATFTASSPTVVITLRGDTSNQVQHDAMMDIEYETYTPI